MIITTVHQLEKYEVLEYLGIVGEQIVLDSSEINKKLEELAAKKGANAVIGLVIQPITEISGGVGYTESDTSLCYAYGTAVKICKINHNQSESGQSENIPLWSQPSQKQPSPRIIEPWDK